jgi:hypothetical protein
MKKELGQDERRLHRSLQEISNVRKHCSVGGDPSILLGQDART